MLAQPPGPFNHWPPRAEILDLLKAQMLNGRTETKEDNCTTRPWGSSLGRWPMAGF